EGQSPRPAVRQKVRRYGRPVLDPRRGMLRLYVRRTDARWREGCGIHHRRAPTEVLPILEERLRRARHHADASIGKSLTDEQLASDLVARLAALPRTDSFRAVGLTPDLDPRTLLADPVAGGVTASYERPDRGLVLVGVGEARRIEVPAGRGPSAVREDVRQLFEAPVEGDAPGLRPRL